MAEFQFFDNFDNQGVTPAPMEITAPTVPAAPVEIAEAETAPTVPEPPEEVQETEPRETNQLQQGPNAQENYLRVYCRRKKTQKEKEPSTSQMQSHESNQAPENEISPGNQISNSEPVHTSIAELDILIALRKGVRTCTHHPIEKYVSYGKLSQGYRTFVASLDSTQIPRNLHEALQHPEWTAAVIEEFKPWLKTTLGS